MGFSWASSVVYAKCEPDFGSARFGDYRPETSHINHRLWSSHWSSGSCSAGEHVTYIFLGVYLPCYYMLSRDNSVTHSDWLLTSIPGLILGTMSETALNSINLILNGYRGTRQRSLFVHYATSHEVSGSIPNKVIVVVNSSNPFSRTVTLGSTQPLREMSTKIFLGIRASGA
jgi:hypothetical protein